MTSKVVWAEVSAEDPWNRWWPLCAKTMGWKQDLPIERWPAHQFQWSNFMDSAKTLSLFGQKKVLVISDADKTLKLSKDPSTVLETLKTSSHFIVLQSEKSPDKKWALDHFVPESNTEKATDDKSAFRWIEALMRDQLTASIQELETSLQNHQHPMALLQLMGRHFRMGRLIQYALQRSWSDQDIANRVHCPSFVVQKWAKQGALPQTRWATIFDRLLLADLQLKSGADGASTLRKLTFDLQQILKEEKTKRPKAINPRPMQLFSGLAASISASQQLLPIATSFVP